ncbi:MAG: hypothetical protein WBA93_27505 [Microcoleaceae cyanobacterium]
MFDFLIDESKYKIIHLLNYYTEQNQPFEFNVTSNAASDLRILRDFQLIATKSHISQMETDINRRHKAIDLTQYCAMTELAHQFRKTKEQFQTKVNNTQTLESLQ